MRQRGNQQNGILDRPASAKEWGQRMGSELQARFPSPVASWCLSRGVFCSPFREPGEHQLCEDRTCPRRTFLTNRRLMATISNRQTIGGKRVGGYPVTLGHRAYPPIWSRYGVRGDENATRLSPTLTSHNETFGESGVALQRVARLTTRWIVSERTVTRRQCELRSAKAWTTFHSSPLPRRIGGMLND